MLGLAFCLFTWISFDLNPSLAWSRHIIAANAKALFVSHITFSKYKVKKSV